MPFEFEFFHAYLLTFFIGFFWAVVSALLGGVFGGDGGIDHGDIGGVHLDPGLQLEPGMVHFSPLSPTILSTFMATFGGVGMICLKIFNLSEYSSIPVAVLSGLGVSLAVFYAMQWVFQKTQGTVYIDNARLVGMRADVITPIPADGFGEIAYVTCGTRQSAAARAVDNQPIDRHTEVEIVRVVGGSFVVRRVGVAVEARAGQPPAPDAVAVAADEAKTGPEGQ